MGFLSMPVDPPSRALSSVRAEGVHAGHQRRGTAAHQREPHTRDAPVSLSRMMLTVALPGEQRHSTDP